MRVPFLLGLPLVMGLVMAPSEPSAPLEAARGAAPHAAVAGAAAPMQGPSGTDAPSAATEGMVQPAPAVRFETVGDGNRARYRVRERLAGFAMDNDAVGETRAVSGAIVLDATGRVVPAASGFRADMSTLRSDKPRRDTYVRRRLLVTDSFPATTFRATSARGLPVPLPARGTVRFELLGDLTVRGVTRPTTWAVTATLDGDGLGGQAATHFTFADFRIPQPRVSVVLSVADTIGLEYDFRMRRVP